MRSLLLAELRRFRTPALVAALVHALLLGAIGTLDELFVPSEPRLLLAALGYSLGGLILGLYQIRSYRRGDLWAFLLHRPLSPRRIFLALAGASALLLALAAWMPLTLAAGLAALGPQGVDARHFLLAPYAWGCALAFYFAGCILALTPWRGAFLTASLALVFLLPAPLGGWAFVAPAFALALLCWLAAAAMRPDLGSPPRGGGATAVAALPGLYLLYLVVSFGILLVYSLGTALVDQGLWGVSRFAWNDYFPAGSVPGLGYLPAREALMHGLRQGPAAAHGFESEVAKAEVLEIVQRLGSFSRRHQPLFLDRALVFEEEGTRGRWIFRHDRMMFAGRDPQRGLDLGWLGIAALQGSGEPGSSRPFEAVPLVFVGGQILTPRRLFRFDGRQHRIEPRYTLPEGERFLSPVQLGPTLDLMLSDHALRLFAPGALLGVGAPPRPLAAVPLEGEASNLERALVAPVGEGYLISLVFGSRSERGFAVARQLLLRVAADGDREELADLRLSGGMPSSVLHRGFLVSPALQTLDDLVRYPLFGAGPRTARPADLTGHPPPPAILLSALVLALLSAASTWLLAGRRGLRPQSRRAWTLAALLLGLPVPFALPLFTSRSA